MWCRHVSDCQREVVSPESELVNLLCVCRDLIILLTMLCAEELPKVRVPYTVYLTVGIRVALKSS